MGAPHGSTADRFWPKVNKDGASVRPELGPCWLWTACTGHYGYGQLRVENANGIVGRTKDAHRISWEMHRGPIPVGMHVLHRCDVRACVNPAHLFLGTNDDNMRDMLTKGRHGGTAKTHCRSGHAYDEANTRRDKYGQRSCRECSRIRCAEYKAKNLEKERSRCREYVRRTREQKKPSAS